MYPRTRCFYLFYIWRPTSRWSRWAGSVYVVCPNCPPGRIAYHTYSYTVPSIVFAEQTLLVRHLACPSSLAKFCFLAFPPCAWQGRSPCAPCAIKIKSGGRLLGPCSREPGDACLRPKRPTEALRGQALRRARCICSPDGNQQKSRARLPPLGRQAKHRNSARLPGRSWTSCKAMPAVTTAGTKTPALPLTPSQMTAAPSARRSSPQK